MTTDISQISPDNFVCNVCSITCSRQTEWNRHINTIKHNRNKNSENSNVLATTVTPIICECGK